MNYTWLVIAIFFSATIAITAKAASHHSSQLILFITLSVILSLGLVFSYYHLFKDSGLSVSYAIAKIASLVITIIAGVWIFKETLTISQLGGIALGLIAIYMLMK